MLFCWFVWIIRQTGSPPLSCDHRPAFAAFGGESKSCARVPKSGLGTQTVEPALPANRWLALAASRATRKMADAKPTYRELIRPTRSSDEVGFAGRGIITRFYMSWLHIASRRRSLCSLMDSSIRAIRKVHRRRGRFPPTTDGHPAHAPEELLALVH